MDEDIGQIYGGNYIKCADLQGRAVGLTIKSYVVKEFEENGKKKKKAVLSFEKTDKQFVCNFTNAGAIAFLYGPKIPQWIGKRIVLVPAQTQFGAGMVDCVRVRPPDDPTAIGNGGAPQRMIGGQLQGNIGQMQARHNYDLHTNAPQPTGEMSDDSIPW